MKKTTLIAGLLLAAVIPGALRAQDGLRTSVLKVFVVQKPADYYQPWQMGYQMPSSGSGFILSGHRIITNAHVVSDQVHIQVMKAGDTRKYTAKVVFVGHDTDLAELSVSDPAFFDGTKPVVFGPMPKQRDRVAAYGFPAGGDELSITEGVVSRIEVRPYAHSGSNLLTVQTDAAINPGNSGGPVFKDGKFVGVSFQGYSGAQLQNTGYFIPTVLVERFLKDVADGSYDGVPGMGVVWQKLENPALRRRLGLPGPNGGVMITKVIPGAGADGVLKEGDVLNVLDGVPVAENGTIPFGDAERVDLSHLLSLHQMSETAKVQLWRDGKTLNVDVPLYDIPDLVPGPEYDKRPSYFVYAGLVFQNLNQNFMRLFDAAAPVRMRDYAELGLKTEDLKEVVFINVVLPHDVNVGYHKLGQAIVTEVNGQKIHQLKDVITALKKPQDGYQVVKLDHWNGSPDNRAAEVVLDAKEADKANAEILKAFGIASDRSDDLKDEEAPEKAKEAH
jgi:S1-C subfamily serine protease